MKQTKRTLVSLLLVFAMLATCLVAFSVTTSAANPVEDTKKDGTLPSGIDESLIGGGDATDWTDCTGTEADPYLIANATDWYNFISYCNANDATDKHFKLTGNIYIRDKYESYGPDNMPTVPDGAAEINDKFTSKDRYESIVTFNGVLDGDGYAIYNLYTLRGNTVGIFKTLSGTVKNLNLYGGVVIGRNFSGEIGTICGVLSDGTIENCYSSMSIASGGGKVAGFAGKVTGTSSITNCTYAGVINYTGGTNNATAGIAGRVEGNLTLTGCVNSAKIVSSGGRVGGLVGFFYSSAATLSFTNCVNTGDIHSSAGGSNDGTGGLLGLFYAGSKLEMYNCANTGNVTWESTGDKAFVGGLTGSFEKTNLVVMIGCYNSGSISGVGASGLVSYCAPSGTGVIAGCYSETPTLNNTNSQKGSGILFGWMKNVSAIRSVAKKTSDSTAKAVGSYNSSTVSNSITTYTEGAVGLTDGTALSLLNATATDETLAAYTTNWVGYVQGATAPFLKILAAQVAIDGATLALDDTMTLKLFVKASTAAKIDGLKSIMVNDGTTEGDYKGTLDAKTGNYVFEITGLAAKDMGTAKTYTVKYTLASDTANPIVCDTGVEYSPLQYAINMYKKNNGSDANFAALLTSMVRYMDAAGATGAKTTFATETEYTFDDAAAETAYTEIMKKATEYNIPADTMSLAAELTSGITLLVKPADGKTLTSVKIGTDTDALTLESVGDNIWRVNGLNPGDLYNELTFTITTTAEETEVTVTVTYSVARYLNNYVSTEYETLAKATALYMNAFITYKTLG